MVIGPSDIPIVGKVVEKVSDFAVEALFRGLKYMFYYKSLVNEHNSEIDKLNNAKFRMTIKIGEERDNGRIIFDEVLAWQTSVEGIQRDQELSPSFSCIQCLPIPNPVTRFRMGREAFKNAKEVKEFTTSGENLLSRDISYFKPPSQHVWNMSGTAFEDFPSRKAAYEKLWEKLLRKDSLVLGIYGMPGVGKTRMMENLCKDVEAKEIFDKVTLAVVGTATYDVIKLQDQLASYLNCNFESVVDVSRRANQLKQSMMSSGKILIIFDDVWSKIFLNNIIGTSFDEGDSWKGCKMLFTSQKRIHCVHNNCHDPVKITTLEDNEALDLFKNTLSTQLTVSPPNESLVEQVCRKCGNLPLVIHAVGEALKFQTQIFWENALKNLEDCNIDKVDGITTDVYACLKLSFDNLHEDEKQCLFLCSLFFADEIISIKTLTELATGSLIVEGGRTSVCVIVKTLKSSSLLLKGRDDEEFKLHDIIRDVARSIAQKDYGYLIKKYDRGSGLAGTSADYATKKVMHLEVENNDFHFPPDLVFPELHTLFLQANPNLDRELQSRHKTYVRKFSGGMFANLRFMVLIGFYSKQQLHLQHLARLKTLFMVRCNLRHTNVSCFPKSLESLCIWGCKLPKTLNFSKLINLRKLDITGGSNAPQIVPNTLAGLSYLEKLHLDSYGMWIIRSEKIFMPTFNEISKLTSLTSLKIFWSEIPPSQDTNMFSSLAEFDIRVGVLEDMRSHAIASVVADGRGKEEKLSLDTTSRKLIWLSGKHQFRGFDVLVERAEKVILSKTDVNVSKIWYRNRNAFQDLKYLYIEECDTMNCVARISQDQIQSSHWQRTSFSKLSTLHIRTCSAIKSLFSRSVAKCLVELQYLSISACHAMEVIVINEKGASHDGDILVFSKLKSLKLLNLSSLKSFYTEMKDYQRASRLMMENSAHFVQFQPLFDGMVHFPSLENLKIRGLNVSEIWGKSYYIDDSLSSSFPKLKGLNISDSPHLKNVLQHSCVGRNLIAHLKKIKVRHCNMMRDVIGAGERKEISDDGVIIFPELMVLNLQNLPNLSSFWCYGQANTYKVEFPNLVNCVLSLAEINLDAVKVSQLRHLNMAEHDKDTPPPSTWQHLLDDLEKLTLGGSMSIALKSNLSFHGLNHLHVAQVECSTLFSVSVLAGLQQLKELRISDSDILEEFVEDVSGDEISGMEMKTIILSRLELINLTDLPNLKTFTHGANFRLHLPALKYLQVTNCGLSTLFTCSVVLGLQQLKELEVDRCSLLECIVADKRGTGKIIKLPQLSLVDFKDLPSLKNFSPAVTYAFNIPRNFQFTLEGCPCLEYFTPLKTSTVRCFMFSEWHHCKIVEDLNDYIKQYHALCCGVDIQPLKMSFFSYAWSPPWAC